MMHNEDEPLKDLTVAAALHFKGRSLRQKVGPVVKRGPSWRLPEKLRKKLVAGAYAINPAYYKWVKRP